MFQDKPRVVKGWALVTKQPSVSKSYNNSLSYLPTTYPIYWQADTSTYCLHFAHQKTPIISIQTEMPLKLRNRVEWINLTLVLQAQLNKNRTQSWDMWNQRKGVKSNKWPVSMKQSRSNYLSFLSWRSWQCPWILVTSMAGNVKQKPTSCNYLVTWN